jgi:hypothetical protein
MPPVEALDTTEAIDRDRSVGLIQTATGRPFSGVQMVHVLAPRPPLSGIPVFYNVDTSVGRNGHNSSFDDILLVQYFLSLIGKNPSPGSTLRSLADIPVTGRMNPETIKGIELVQTANHATVDGRVSVAQGYKYGANFYTIVSLNFNVKERFKSEWPNIEEMPACPVLLNLACRRALSGTT